MAGSTTAKRAPRSPRAATRKPTTKRPVTVTAFEDGFEPLRFVTPAEPPKVETVELFSIDGRPYFIPRKPSPSVSLRFMKVARVAGMELALGELLEKMLGEDAYDALTEYEHLTDEQFADLMDRVRRHAMGAVEGPKEPSNSG